MGDETLNSDLTRAIFLLPQNVPFRSQREGPITFLSHHIFVLPFEGKGMCAVQIHRREEISPAC